MTDTIKFNLQQFAEGGDAGATGEGETAGAAEAEAEAAAKHAEEWNNLIKGDFRDDYKRAIEESVHKRFAKQAELEDQVNRSQKLVSFLSQKYGSEDEGEILEALMNDDALFEQEAAERGLTTEQYKEFKRLEFDKALADQELEEQERQRAAEATYAEWMRQSDNVKQMYPEFDLEVELENDKFSRLLANNVDMLTAYQVCHMDEVVTGAMQLTAHNVAEKLTDSIRTKGLRPLENGIGSSSQPVKEQFNIDNMSLDEMKTLARRAGRGERITLR